MDESVEAKWLREHWNNEFLGQYDNQWIAVQNESIVASGNNLEQVIIASSLIKLDHKEPLYAFIYFGRFQ